MQLPPPAMPSMVQSAECFVIVLNAGSGRHDADAVREHIQQLLAAAGHRAEFHIVEDGQKPSEIARKAAQRVLASGGVLVACGGDGTINAVAAAALAEDVPLGIIPQGTFNFFGRAHGVSSDVDEAVAAMLASKPRSAQVGLVNGKVFLVNASLGLYPQVLHDREAWKNRLGRRRIVALFSGLLTLARDHRLLDIEISDGTSKQVLRTPTLVVGNNPLQFAKLGIGDSDRVGRGELVAISLRPIGKLGMLGLILRGALGRLGEAEDVTTHAFRKLSARPRRALRRRKTQVAVDGEILHLDMPLVFEISPRPLRLLAALPAGADEDPG